MFMEKFQDNQRHVTRRQPAGNPTLRARAGFRLACFLEKDVPAVSNAAGYSAESGTPAIPCKAGCKAESGTPAIPLQKAAYQPVLLGWVQLQQAKYQPVRLGWVQLRLGRNRFNKGQQVSEYALFVSVVFLALLVMFIYTRRGLQAVIKEAADQMGPQVDSLPLSSTMGSETAESTSTTLTSDTTRTEVAGGQRVVSTELTSNTFGNATIVTEERIR